LLFPAVACDQGGPVLIWEMANYAMHAQTGNPKFEKYATHAYKKLGIPNFKQTAFAK
jgi:hypothetical protein